MASLSEALQSITRLNVKYVVFKGWSNLPNNPSETIHVLTDDLRAFVRLMGLEQVAKSRLYELVLGSPKSGCQTVVKFCLYEKGKQFFPSQFESYLIERAVVFNDCVRIPDDIHAFHALIYMNLFHTKLYTGKEDRDIIKLYLCPRVGDGVEPEYEDVDFYP